MIKSVVAVSEGGPDAAMAFGLAARVASVFDAAVEAMHLPVGRGGPLIDGLSGAGEGLIMNVDDQRLQARKKESERQYADRLGGSAGSSYAVVSRLDTLVRHGRCADLVVVGRPGADFENVEPISVRAALHDCARPVMVAPPEPGAGRFASIVIAWNGSFEATRAVQHALPFLQAAARIVVAVVGQTPANAGVDRLIRNLSRHGLEPRVEALHPGAISGRSRGRALLDFVHGSGTDLLVMGAYGNGRLMRFLGMGGATGKVISSSRVPLLMAR